jgi:hypothetical protein
VYVSRFRLCAHMTTYSEHACWSLSIYIQARALETHCQRMHEDIKQMQQSVVSMRAGTGASERALGGLLRQHDSLVCV